MNRTALLSVTFVLSVFICGSLYFEEINLMFLDGEIVTQSITVPVEVQMDSEKYHVSGIPDTVNVELKGPAAALQVLKNQNTISVVVDLDGYGPGLNEIFLKASNVPADIESVVEPDAITVNIANKIRRSFLVTPELLLAGGQDETAFNTPVLSTNRVTITGVESSIDAIRSVKAIIDASGQDGDFTAQAIVVAYDSSGKQLSDVQIDPDVISAEVTVAAEKTEEPQT